MTAAFDRGAKEFDAQVAEQKAYVDVMLAVAKDSIDRSRESGKSVQTAATAVGTIYTGVLALVFSVTGRQLPPRGLLTPLALGAAVLLANVYLNYLTRVTTSSPYPSPRLSGWLPDSHARVAAFAEYAKKIVDRRAVWLRASVLALGASLLFIAAPFVSFAGSPAISTAPTLTPTFPVPTATGTTPTSLDQIRYQAQLDDVSELHKAQITSAAEPAASGWTGEDLWWFVVALMVAVVVVLVARAGPRPEQSSADVGRKEPATRH